jgi:diguanylate cyclase (GGDEF)-like protein
MYTKSRSLYSPVIRWISNNTEASSLFRDFFIFLAWLSVWQVGRLMEYAEHASVWFPAAGLTFSCFLVLGYRALLPIIAAAIITTIWNGYHYDMGLALSELVWGGFLFSLAHIAPYWAGAHIVGKISKTRDVNTPLLIVSFLLISCISSLLATGLVIASLVATAQMPMADVEGALLPFWIGDMAGVVVLAPLFTATLTMVVPKSLVHLDQFTRSKFGSLESALQKIGLNVLLVVLTMLLAYLTGSKDSSFAIFFLAVTHMWIACTESPKFNVVSLAISSCLIVVLVYFFGLMEFAKVYQFAINVIAANALFGIAVPQLQADNRQLKDQVFIDRLTNAYSRDYMEQRAELEIAQSHESNSNLFLVVFDLDGFKTINDELGHIAGDEALKKLSIETQEALRKTDIFARFGGDEFVLLLPRIKAQKAREIVDDVRIRINNILIGDKRLSSSFGVAQLLPNETLTALFKRADAALYRAKRNGGNQISMDD